jgi:hypothetical protein
MSISLSVHIEAPVETVFAAFADPASWGDLQPDIEFTGVHVTPGGLGTYYAWRTRLLGLPIRGVNVFTEFIRNERITDRSSMSLEGTWAYSFAPEGSGTTVTLENDARGLWRFPPLAWLLDRIAVEGHEKVLERAKARLESARERPTAVSR